MKSSGRFGIFSFSLHMFLGFFLLTAGNAFAADKANVTLKLVEAKAEKQEDGDLLVTCRVILDNKSGKEMQLKTHFGSVFDGLWLTVTDLEGKVLAEQGYTYHQSPYGPEPLGVQLKVGRTMGDLAFPLAKKGRISGKIRIQLAGLLPGIEPGVILTTEPKEALVKAK